MRPALACLLAVAAAVTTADLVHKAVVVADRGHELLWHDRHPAYALAIVVVALGWGAAVALTRSKLVGAAAGVMVGGAAGNALSLALWPAYEGVPNPFFVGELDWGIAFNIGDVCVGAGLMLVLLSLLAFIRVNRHRLGHRVL